MYIFSFIWKMGISGGHLTGLFKESNILKEYEHCENDECLDQRHCCHYVFYYWFVIMGHSLGNMEHAKMTGLG